MQPYHDAPPPDSDDEGHRGFDEIHVAKICGRQLAESRYGPDARRAITEMLQTPFDQTGQHEYIPYEGWEDGSSETESDYQQGVFSHDSSDHRPPTPSEPSFPSVARARMNLTALSQRFDLYFVAYADEVHVFRPARPPMILDGLQVRLRPCITRAALYVNAAIDPSHPHQINHLIVGDLGDHEVLLLCTDDGDLAAYYTQTIAGWIDHNRPEYAPGDGEGAQPRVPREFFHENVGSSAWGLALHKKSRLIAVSSNHHEVTVFAFALNGTTNHEKLPPSQVLPVSDPVASLILKPKLEKNLRARNRCWRIVLPLGPSAGNLPNISFWDDLSGNAERVAAVDIFGILWVVDLWKIGTKPVKIFPHGVPDPASGRLVPPRGWGVMVLTDTHFQPTTSLLEYLGLHPADIQHHCADGRSHQWAEWADISKCMMRVRHNAAEQLARNRFISRPHLNFVDLNLDPDLDVDDEVEGDDSGDDEAGNPEEDLDSDDEDDPEDEDETEMQDEKAGLGGSRDWSRNQNRNDQRNDNSDRLEFHLASTVVPFTGEYFTEFTEARLRDFTSHTSAMRRANAIPEAWPPEMARKMGQLCDENLKTHYSILRSNATDVELINLGPRSTGVVCHRLVEKLSNRADHDLWDFSISQRCNMLLLVPEMSLVVVGSMCGRVALITLTEAPSGTPTHQFPARGFRVEHVLPRDYEEGKAARPNCCLLGVAVSPVPESRTKGLDLRRDQVLTVRPPTRWRLILNYQDHTILTYELSKAEPLAELEVTL